MLSGVRYGHPKPMWNHASLQRQIFRRPWMRTLKDPVLHSASCALVDFIFSVAGAGAPQTHHSGPAKVFFVRRGPHIPEHRTPSCPIDADRCKCNCIRAPQVRQRQNFDRSHTNEAKLRWSLCMLSTNLTRVLTWTLVGQAIGRLKMYNETYLYVECPTYLRISVYGCRKELVNDTKTSNLDRTSNMFAQNFLDVLRPCPSINSLQKLTKFICMDFMHSITLIRLLNLAWLRCYLAAQLGSGLNSSFTIWMG